jgi:hypothetical protein
MPRKHKACIRAKSARPRGGGRVTYCCMAGEDALRSIPADELIIVDSGSATIALAEARATLGYRRRLKQAGEAPLRWAR